MNDPSSDTGIRRLIKTYLRWFRIPENLEHYAPEDLARAEKQFVKHCLREGWIGAREEDGYGR